MSYDFDRVMTLINIYEKIAMNGMTALNPIGAAAMEELKAMVRDETDPKPRVVTPPEGPANSAIENPDGTITRIGGNQPLENTTAGKRDNLNQPYNPDSPPEGTEPLGDASEPAPGYQSPVPPDDPSNPVKPDLTADPNAPATGEPKPEQPVYEPFPDQGPKPDPEPVPSTDDPVRRL